MPTVHEQGDYIPYPDRREWLTHPCTQQLIRALKDMIELKTDALINMNYQTDSQRLGAIYSIQEMQAIKEVIVSQNLLTEEEKIELGMIDQEDSDYVRED